MKNVRSFFFIVLPFFLAGITHALPTVETLDKNRATAGKKTSLDFTTQELSEAARILLSPASAMLKKTTSLPAIINDVVINEQQAYLAADYSGLFIVDLPEQDNDAHKTANLRTRHSVGDQVTSLKIHGHYAYLAAIGGLYIVDISNPDAPQTLSYYRTSSAITALALNKNYAALLTAEQQLLLLDIRNKEKPRLHSISKLDGMAHSLSIVGNTIYVANDAKGLFVLKLIDGKLIQSANYHTTGPTLDIVVENNIAYLANGENGLTILDISNPGKINWLGSHQQLGNAHSLQLTNEQLWVLNAAGQYLLVDISNPAMPSIISAFRPSHATSSFSVVDDTLHTVNNLHLRQYDVSRSAPQISNESLDFGQGVNFGGQRRIFIRDNLAYVADWFSGLHIYDISKAEHPHLLSTFHTEGSSKGVIVRGDHAFVADDDHGLQIINIKDPRQPFRVSQLQTPGLAYIPVLDGDRLYLAGHHGGFQIIDISDPNNPSILGSHDTSGKTWGIQIKNNHVYIADDDAGLMIFNVSDPQHIKMLGQFNPGGDAEDILLNGNIAYVAFFENGVFIIDISDPGFPRQLAHIATPGNARGLALRNQHLYVADWLSGIQVIDISNAKQAHIVGSYDSKGASWGLAIKDEQAYIMDWWGGFSVLNIGQTLHPLPNPQLAGQYINPQIIRAYAAHDNVLFTAWGKNGLQIFDITNPLNPTWMTGVDTPAAVVSIALWQDYAYLALTNKRIAVVDISNPHQSSLVKLFRSGRNIKRLVVKNGKLLLASKDGSLTIYSLKNPQKPKKGKRIKTGILDFDINKQQQLVTSGTEGVAVYDLARANKPRLLYTHNTPGQLLRTHKQYLYQYHAPSSKISVFKMLTDQLQAVTTISVGKLLDMQIDNQTLTLIEADSRIKQIDISEPSSWHYKARYQTLGSVSSALMHQATLYLAGDNNIIALRPLPETTISLKNSHKLELTIPAEMPTGDYDLLWQTNTQDLPVASFSVEMPRFGKPRLSLDDLKKIMKEKLELSPEQMQSH